MKYLNFLESGSVLIVDDQSTSRTILSHMIHRISTKLQVHQESKPEDALAWAKNNRVDLVLVDFVMPNMNGIEFTRALKTLAHYEHVPVVVVTLDQSVETRYAAIKSGVSDFLTKPLDMQECIGRCKNLLSTYYQRQILEDKSSVLESMVKKATEEIHNREKETLMRLARAGEYKDKDTAKHLVRMALYSRLLAEAIGLSVAEAELIEQAAPLHDIGKIGIPDSILLKNGKLNDEEWKVMQGHPQIGYDILQDSPSKYLQMGGEIALAHHERYDGTGYPKGLVGEAIPLAARIVAIADVFDALTSIRPYKNAWTIEAAMDFIVTQSNSHFDPELVNAMVSIRDKVTKIHAQHADAE